MSSNTTDKGLPIVAIVGRPNVGKSSIFNRLIGLRVAIEDPIPGTTRDRVSFHWRLGKDRLVELIDAAGIGQVDKVEIEAHVNEQIHFAVDRADLLVVVTDVKAGVLPLDVEVADRLRRLNKPVILVGNKADAPHQDALAQELQKLGLGDPLPCSAKERRGLVDLKDAILDLLPPRREAENVEPPVMKLAIVGKRNSGKSSLVNLLAADDRVIVSEIPGTTRDSVDVHFTYQGMEFIAIDTAGIQRKRGIANSVDFYGQARSVKAIRRADVVVLLMDCLEQTSRLDRKLTEASLRECTPVIIGVNKWDLAGEITPERFQKYVDAKLQAISFAPVVYLSVKNELNHFKLVDIALDLHRQTHYRVGTGELNRVVHAAISRNRPRGRKGKIPKIYYATQIEVAPPTILIYVNEASSFPDSWRDYLKNRLRREFQFGEIPLKVIFKNRERIELTELLNQ